MATTEEVKIKFTADVEALKASMTKAGASTKEINAAVRQLTKEYAAADKAAKAAAKSAGQLGDKTKASVGVAQRVMATFGGATGAAGGKLAQLTEAANIAGTQFGALGTAGVAFVGTIALVAGGAVMAYQAMDALADSATLAHDRLLEIDGAEKAPIALGEALAQWDEATLKLEASTALLTTQLATYLLPGVSDILDKVTAAISGYEKLWGAISGGTITTEQAGRSVLAVGQSVLLVSTGIDTLAESAANAGPRLTDLSKITADLTAEELALGIAYGTIVDESDKATTSTKRLAAAQVDAAAVAMEATNAAYVAMGKEAEKLERDRAYAAEQEAKRTADFIAGLELRAATTQATAEIEIAAWQQQLAANSALSRAVSDGYLGSLGLAVAVADAKVAAAEDGSAAEMAAAQKAFAVKQAMSIATIGAEAPGMLFSMIGNLALALGPAAIPVAAAIVGTTVAASLVAVASAPPPQFQDGGVIRQARDHQTIGASAGEGIVTRRGMAALGEEGLDALNQRRAGGGGGATAVQMRYRHRDLGIVLRDHMRLDTPLARALDSAKPPGRRR